MLKTQIASVTHRHLCNQVCNAILENVRRGCHVFHLSPSFSIIHFRPPPPKRVRFDAATSTTVGGLRESECEFAQWDPGPIPHHNATNGPSFRVSLAKMKCIVHPPSPLLSPPHPSTHSLPTATVLLVLLALALHAPQTHGLPSVSLGLPLTTLQSLVGAEGPKISAKVAADLSIPSSCCWDNVGEKTVHLCLQNQKLSDVGVSSKLVGDTGGITIDYSGSGVYTSSYRLCAKEIIGGCSKLFGCSGGATVKTDVDGGFPVSLQVESGGKIGLVSGTGSAKVSVVEDTFCSKIAGEVSKTVAGIGGKAEAAVQKAVDEALAGIAAKIPYKEVVEDVVEVSWLFDAAGSALNGKVGMELTGDVDVADVATHTPLPAPYTPRAALPEIAQYLSPPSSKAAFAVADSVASNVAWAAWKSGKLNIHINSTIDGQHVEGSGSVTASPTILFGDNDAGFDMVLHLNASAAASVGPVSADPTFGIVAGANITFNATENGFVASIELIEFTVGNVSTFIGAAIKIAALKEVTDLNAKLAQMALHFPTVDGISLKAPSLSFTPGSALLVATPVVSSSSLMHATTRGHSHPTPLGPLSATPLACPAIPGAHLDSCGVC